jgi:hypothetical protein
MLPGETVASTANSAVSHTSSLRSNFRSTPQSGVPLGKASKVEPSIAEGTFNSVEASKASQAITLIKPLISKPHSVTEVESIASSLDAAALSIATLSVAVKLSQASGGGSLYIGGVKKTGGNANLQRAFSFSKPSKFKGATTASGSSQFAGTPEASLKSKYNDVYSGFTEFETSPNLTEAVFSSRAIYLTYLTRYKKSMSKAEVK